jgi:hypothetical protein
VDEIAFIWAHPPRRLPDTVRAMSEDCTTPIRWFVVEYRTGTRAKNQPSDGFATEGEAIAWHRDFMGGDLRYSFAEEQG